ncbi:MAG: SRPBCC family protein [Pyrinomonadaceae bacterium]|nr:DUF2892 domain-containing protein [Blastocatellia bacterium]MDQ3220236.1 DUF2892 domain-containing protein [Acidobacteriota bacterium]MDQ3489534.1 DUF2892 domain-containing protein [Acidobacteriota bacterium]
MHHNETYDRNRQRFAGDSSTNIHTAERVASAVSGGALIAYGIKRSDLTGALISLAGAALALRGTTGHSQIYDALGIRTASSHANPASPYNKTWLSGTVHVNKAITINKSPAELYQFWRNFENLPQFMKHLESVTASGEQTSHWIAKAPLGYTVEWDAEITSDVLNEKIGWKSVEGSDIPNSGVVEFLPTSNRGTEIRVSMTYESPAGKLGSLVAKLFGEEPAQQVGEDLRRFKRLMETGIIMSVEGQTSGRKEFAKARAASA